MDLGVLRNIEVQSHQPFPLGASNINRFRNLIIVCAGTIKMELHMPNELTKNGLSLPNSGAVL